MKELYYIVEALSTTYPHRQLELKQECGSIYLYADGECNFCVTGYCLLYNMKRLCDILNDELL